MSFKIVQISLLLHRWNAEFAFAIYSRFVFKPSSLGVVATRNFIHREKHNPSSLSCTRNRVNNMNWIRREIDFSCKCKCIKASFDIVVAWQFPRTNRKKIWFCSRNRKKIIFKIQSEDLVDFPNALFCIFFSLSLSSLHVILAQEFKPDTAPVNVTKLISGWNEWAHNDEVKSEHDEIKVKK